MERYDITGMALPTFVHQLPNGKRVRLLPPKKAVYDRLPRTLAAIADRKSRTPETLRELYDVIHTLLCNNADGYVSTEGTKLRREIPYSVAVTLLTEYAAWLFDILSEARLQLPSAPTEQDTDEIPLHYEIPTATARAVSAYSGLTVPEAMELNIVDFRLLRRDAYIYGLSGTKKGREYLELCWCREQTKPDRGVLREMFGGRG